MVSRCAARRRLVRCAGVQLAVSYACLNAQDVSSAAMLEPTCRGGRSFKRSAKPAHFVVVAKSARIHRIGTRQV